MGEWLGPLRATLRAALRRRATWMLLAAITVAIGITVYGSYSSLRSQRAFLAQMQRGAANVFFPTVCTDTECHLLGPDGKPVGPALSHEEESLLNRPPNAPSDDAARQQVLAKVRPTFVAIQRAYIRATEAELSPRAIFPQRARSLGTLWGIAVAGLLGATLFGAEWRWSVWRTQLSHEPRRGRVLAAKLVGLWGLVAIGFVLVLLLAAGADVFFRLFLHVGAHGGPGIAAIAGRSARPLVGVELYASLAAMFAVLFRSSLAGLGGPLVLVLADGLLTRRFEWLRVFLPTQQIAWLLPHHGPYVDVAAPWWPLIGDKVLCPVNTGSQLGNCIVKMLPPIPQPRAMLVLGAWLIGAVALAWVAMRARDVPQ